VFICPTGHTISRPGQIHLQQPQQLAQSAHEQPLAQHGLSQQPLLQPALQQEAADVFVASGAAPSASVPKIRMVNKRVILSPIHRATSRDSLMFKH
jgi:hypothetical protein